MTNRTAALLRLISEQIRDAAADGILPLTRAEREIEAEDNGFRILTSRPVRPIRRKPRRTDHERIGERDAWYAYMTQHQ